jgi:hypothetical protein
MQTIMYGMVSKSLSSHSGRAVGVSTGSILPVLCLQWVQYLQLFLQNITKVLKISIFLILECWSLKCMLGIRYDIKSICKGIKISFDVNPGIKHFPLFLEFNNQRTVCKVTVLYTRLGLY